MSKFVIYIVTQDLNGGIVYRSGFTSLEEAKKCQEAWWVKWGRRPGKPTIHEQLVWESFNDI